MDSLVKPLKQILSPLFDQVVGQDPNCMVCGVDVFNPEYGLCQNCYEKLPFAEKSLIEGCLSVCLYEPPVKQLIFDYKYNDQRYIGKYLALLMAEKVLESGMTVDLILVVPSSEKRKKFRGFDHILYIAEILADNLGIYCGAQVLSRRRETRRLKGLSKAQRVEELDQAFVVTEPEAVRGKRILLIDDILTTGATLSACTQELAKYEPASVKWLTFAVVV